MSKIEVIEKQSREVLFSTELDHTEKAYEQAKMYEEMGIDVEISAPSLPETLMQSLGVKGEELAKLRGEINEEIASHDLEDQYGCCFKGPESNSDESQK